LSPEDLLAMEDFTKGSLGCVAPCYLGLTPGESTSLEIDPFLARLGVPVRQRDSFNEGSNHSVYADVPYLSQQQSLTGVAVGLQSGIVSFIALSYFGETHPAFLSFAGIAHKYGTPDRILITIDPSEVDFLYDLFPTYPGPQLAIRYFGALTGTSPTKLCPPQPTQETQPSGSSPQEISNSFQASRPAVGILRHTQG
jgi:hypothetical protein